MLESLCRAVCGQYLQKTSELSIFCNQIWYGGCITMSRSIMRNKKVCCLQVQGHSYDSDNQNVTVSAIASELMILLSNQT